MIALRRSLPWILSVFAHIMLLRIPVQLASTPSPRQPEERRVELIFEGQEAERPSAVDRASLPVESSSLPAVAAAPAPATSTEVPPELTRAAVALLPQEQPLAARPRAVLPGNRSEPAPLASSQFATPQDVLSDMLATAPAQTAPGPQAAPEAPAAGNEPKIEWEGEQRRIVRQQVPQFPRVLQVSGQEVECEAKITVSPAGNVTRVEMVRGSGYTEIDASVVSALRGYVFSRANSAKDAIGTVRLRFRLERGD